MRLVRLNTTRAPRESVRDIQEGFKFQAGMGANMILAVVSSFVISYWASKYIAPDNQGHVRIKATTSTSTINGCQTKDHGDSVERRSGGVG